MKIGIKKMFGWQSALALTLVTLSASVYTLHYLIFRDARYIFMFFLADLAFVFISVLLVTFVINKVLAIREKRSLLNKLNMVIGAFYSEVGMKLIRLFSAVDRCSADIAKELVVKKDWPDSHFEAIRAKISSHGCPIDCRPGDLDLIKDFLIAKRAFMLRLMENPNLLEHATFTDLLWAVFHLTEELENRSGFNDLPKSDYEHLGGDIKRAYALLISEWLAYMKHLRREYPYLFSLALRTNPFDPSASVIVR